MNRREPTKNLTFLSFVDNLLVYTKSFQKHAAVDVSEVQQRMALAVVIQALLVFYYFIY